jgi:Ca2+-binding RTX toxin-like protein
VHPVKIPVAVTFTVLVFGGAAIAATPLRSGVKLTVTPPAYYVGTSGAETLAGTSENDVLIGRGGPDTLYGRGGNDVLQGGIGNDRLYGGSGRDTLTGGPGNDRLYARDARRDVVNGGPGFDQAWVDQLDQVSNVERVYRG